MKKRMIWATVCALAVALACLNGCARQNGTPTDAAPSGTPTDAAPSGTPTDAAEESRFVPALSGTELLPGVTVSDPFPYTGKYMEDGSDDEVENLAAVTLVNSGGTDYLYLEFTLTTADGAYFFAVSSLHEGMAVTVLSRDRRECPSAPAVLSADCPVHVEYQTPPSMREDLFSFTQTTGSFSTGNISGRDLTGTITVYYKSADENGYLGGITFRTVLNGLKAEEERWMPAEHMGRIVFVTYEE